MAARHRQSRNLYEIRKERRTKQERERLLLTSLMIPAFGFLFASAFLFTQRGTIEYYHSQNGLFIGSLVVAGAYIAINRAAPWRTRDLLNKAILSPKVLTIPEWVRLCWMVAFALALVGLLVVDTSFFEHFGLRVGAVCSIAFARILQLAYLSRSGDSRHAVKKPTDDDGTQSEKPDRTNSNPKG
jgi:hypothetical protein